MTHNRLVAGSSPAGATKFNELHSRGNTEKGMLFPDWQEHQGRLLTSRALNFDQFLKLLTHIH